MANRELILGQPITTLHHLDRPWLHSEDVVAPCLLSTTGISWINTLTLLSTSSNSSKCNCSSNSSSKCSPKCSSKTSLLLLLPLLLTGEHSVH